MRKAGLILLVVGIMGNAIFLQMRVENIFHDLTRLLALAGIILIIVSLLKKK